MSLISLKIKLQRNKIGKIILKLYHYGFAVPQSYFYLIKYFIVKRKIKDINFYSYDETFNMLINEKKSLCRFGDGEISWIYRDSKGHFGQENSELLSEMLKQSLLSSDYRVLIGIPNFFGDMKGYSEKRNKARKVHLAKYGIRWMNLVDENKTYVDALISRVYLGRHDLDYKATFDSWKQVWDKRNIVIIEGSETRFGIGNDLLKNAKSISRIIAPAENAFARYNQILNFALNYDKDVLFLIALGPTATVLAYELSQYNYQAIDVGHLDIEYEWYNARNTKKTSIKGKYVNEAGGMPTEELDKEYLNCYYSQIQYRCD
ncbi:MAG: hypothetical protein PWR27_1652 [Petroclostridium sp.]|nr:hypothetical protein [Petroclostridium sp.]